jgi:hypothetical protein
VGSIPITRSILERVMVQDHAHIAQSVEHFLGKEEVTGSNPVMGSSSLVILSLYIGMNEFILGAGHQHTFRSSL